MASIPLGPDIAPVITRSAAAPMPTVVHILGRFERPQLEAFVSVAIDLLDAMDGDLDLGPNGDELDGSAAEDDFYPHSHWKAEPGCPVSDPDMAVDDSPCDDVDQDLEFDDHPVAKRPHIRRIREKRCLKLAQPDPFTGATHRLIEGRA